MATRGHRTPTSEAAAPRVMWAAIVDRYGPPEVVHIADVRRPQPADREVLVRVHAAAVTSQPGWFSTSARQEDLRLYWATGTREHP